MTHPEHVVQTLGSQAFRLCQQAAEIDRLTLEVAALKKQLAETAPVAETSDRSHMRLAEPAAERAG